MKKRIKKKLENRLYNFHYSDFKSKDRMMEDMIVEWKRIIPERRNNTPLNKAEIDVIEQFCFNVVYLGDVYFYRIPHINRRNMKYLELMNYLLDGGIINEQENKEETT